MKISLETLASSTNKNQPPFIPPDIQLSNKTIIERPIPKLIASSTRPMSERITLNNNKSAYVKNAFFRKQPAKIIATHQCRERAWHARLLIGASMLSNIDSTLANVVDVVDEEEAGAFKVSLRLAIANFAATDTSLLTMCSNIFMT